MFKVFNSLKYKIFYLSLGFSVSALVEYLFCVLFGNKLEIYNDLFYISLFISIALWSLFILIFAFDFYYKKRSN